MVAPHALHLDLCLQCFQNAGKWRTDIITYRVFHLVVGGPPLSHDCSHRAPLQPITCSSLCLAMRAGVYHAERQLHYTAVALPLMPA